MDTSTTDGWVTLSFLHGTAMRTAYAMRRCHCEISAIQIDPILPPIPQLAICVLSATRDTTTRRTLRIM